jgi:hypothetical protein
MITAFLITFWLLPAIATGVILHLCVLYTERSWTCTYNAEDRREMIYLVLVWPVGVGVIAFILYLFFVCRPEEK